MNKTALIALMAATISLVGCAPGHHAISSAEPRVSNAPAPTIGYDDRQIAKIRQGETAESQLLEWFGSPASRELKPDGRLLLSWTFSRRNDSGGGHSGTLRVDLGPEGKVEAYSAQGGPLDVNRTVEFADAELRAQLERWRREGWLVHNISGPLSQPDGGVHRRAELSRSASEFASGLEYDDHRIAQIRPSNTTGEQLQEWFGPAYARNLRSDGRRQVCWNFGGDSPAEPDGAGKLNVSLTSDGKVDSYVARRGVQ